MRMHIVKQVPTKGTLRRILKRAIFGKRICCLTCGSRSVRMIKREERWRCRRCHLPFSIKSSCWLKGSKLPLETIWLLLWCWQKKFARERAMDITGISHPTVTLWYEKFRIHIPKERLETVLWGSIACDEMFTKDTAIIGAKQKGTRNIAMRVLHDKHPNKAHAVSLHNSTS
jgi:transposase-like protein